MSIPSFLVVADRGCVKAFEVENTPSRGPMPRLTETFQIFSTPDRFRDEYSDRMGAFPNGGTNGKGNSVAERLSVGEEHQTRACREVARHIEKLLGQYHPTSWGLAAPSEIASAVLDKLTAEGRAKLKTVVKHDLVNSDVKALISQFTEAQALR